MENKTWTAGIRSERARTNLIEQDPEQLVHHLITASRDIGPGCACQARKIWCQVLQERVEVEQLQLLHQLPAPSRRLF